MVIEMGVWEYSTALLREGVYTTIHKTYFKHIYGWGFEDWLALLMRYYLFFTFCFCFFFLFLACVFLGVYVFLLKLWLLFSLCVGLRWAFDHGGRAITVQ
jgi:hypothetical protein